jgi:large subunit ribosomal protein L9
LPAKNIEGVIAMEVILKEDVPQLGHRGDVVKVAEGYGRNYLLPRKLAILANAANKAVIEQMKAAAVRRSVREKTDAEQLAKQYEGLSLHFTRRAGENDQLFGSVTASDIAHELENRGFNVDRRKIEIAHPMKSVGEYTIQIKLHREVSVPVKVTVTKEVEETTQA